MKAVLKKYLVPTVILGTILTNRRLMAEDSVQDGFANGKFIQETESQKATNGFAGKLDITDDPNFFADWQKHWHPVSTFKHGDEFYIVVFVADRPNGLMDSVYDLTIFNPEGKPYITRTNMVALKHPLFPSSGPDSTYLKPSSRLVGLHLDPDDPVGEYKVHVVLKDKVTKTELNLEKKFTVEK